MFCVALNTSGFALMSVFPMWCKIIPLRWGVPWPPSQLECRNRSGSAKTSSLICVPESAPWQSCAEAGAHPAGNPSSAARAPGEIVTRDQIVARVWGKGVFLDTDNSIRGAIRKLRQVLKDDAETPRFIQTVTGQGYRFIALVIAPKEAAQLPSQRHRSSPPATGISCRNSMAGYKPEDCV